MYENNDLQKKPNKKKTFIALGIGILALVVIIVVVLSIKDRQYLEPVETPVVDEKAPEVEEVVLDDGDIVDVESQRINTLITESRTEATGTNLITTDNRVIDSTGLELRSDVEPDSMEAPRASQPINEEELSESVIKIEANEEGFSPNEIRVAANTAVTISLSGKTDDSHILRFEDPELSSIVIRIRNDETRAIAFVTPSRPGEYTFFCDFPGHNYEGLMIVE